ncbi:MAG: NAD(P)H-dependent oxidoreductase subunit E, partial [Anaerolineae bacterium]|nr:NAD(P)H-dependent oxidoreductase subunit E [Anaerolineae bacterium]
MTLLKAKTSSLDEYLEQAAEHGRTMLLPSLLQAQQQHGHISKEHARSISQTLKIPLADVYGVIEFYSLLCTEPAAETVVRVCESPTCAMAGSHQLEKSLSQHASASSEKLGVEGVPCLGLCDNAPAALVGEKPVSLSGKVSP